VIVACGRQHDREVRARETWLMGRTGPSLVSLCYTVMNAQWPGP